MPKLQQKKRQIPINADPSVFAEQSLVVTP